MRSLWISTHKQRADVRTSGLIQLQQHFLRKHGSCQSLPRQLSVLLVVDSTSLELAVNILILLKYSRIIKDIIVFFYIKNQNVQTDEKEKDIC